jgi:outer membrane murein-binding lipoprotein Lpp
MGFITININSNLNQIMSKIDELSAEVAKLQVSVDATQEKVLIAVSGLKATIASLEALLNEGASAEQIQAVIDAVKVVSADVESTEV